MTSSRCLQLSSGMSRTASPSRGCRGRARRRQSQFSQCGRSPAQAAEGDLVAGHTQAASCLKLSLLRDARRDGRGRRLHGGSRRSKQTFSHLEKGKSAESLGGMISLRAWWRRRPGRQVEHDCRVRCSSSPRRLAGLPINALRFIRASSGGNTSSFHLFYFLSCRFYFCSSKLVQPVFTVPRRADRKPALVPALKV